MLNLDKVKFVLYDFDGTLCIDGNCAWTEAERDKLLVRVLQSGKGAWSDCYPSIHMQKFINICIQRGIRQGLLSHDMSYPIFKAKSEWVKDKYGVEMKNHCVAVGTPKVRELEGIARAYGYNKDEILLIDDLWENLNSAANAGFQAASPLEIVEYVTPLEYKE